MTAGRAGWARWVLLGAAVLVGALLVGPPADEGEALDPDSPGPLGALGLVRTLGALGAEVSTARGAPGADVDVAVVLGDRLGRDGRDDLLTWVRGGRTLVVADPSSPLAQVEPTGELVDPRRDAGGCGIDALVGVEELSVQGVGFDLGVRGRGCFSGGDGGSFVVATPVGDGTVVAVGGAAVWVNERLGRADNAVLAGALLAPAEGTQVAVVLPTLVGGGSASLTDLVGDGPKQALLQLGVAFTLYALWRGRRLGRPVPEPQPVELAASELVVAVGDLLQQGRHHGRAAEVIREDLRRHLAARLGLPTSAAPAHVAEVAAARTGLDRRRLSDLLTPAAAAAGGDEVLVELAAAASAVTEELDHVR
ncbi:MAG: hypothetical protein AVDCRST_MAG20-156 [uncultured Acidimicrobiales bacterium]|uniref:DUF4350 domain-containing protein n=1 Tax=uncultured Acidimicrobiales bacterium TaxID=310071 RepID=A0A6J4GY69_9ACTN|nr:MAG: hypothetical protein AVDCRST_MAG20-156 [uncultured Acidimicrobiales bacterium]